MTFQKTHQQLGLSIPLRSIAAGELCRYIARKTMKRK